MKLFVTQLLIAVSVLAIAAETQASILLAPAVRYESLKTTDAPAFSGGNQDTRALSADGKLGFVLDGIGLYVGGLYRYEDSVASSSSEMKGSGSGASVGLVGRQLALIGTFLLAGERTYTVSGVESKLKDGKGFQIDLSYVAGVTAEFGIGPQITYRSLKFAKSQVGTALESEIEFEETAIEPAIVLWYRF